MDTNIGLWIDHRKAVIVIVSDAGEEIRGIASNVQKQLGRINGELSTEPFESLLGSTDDIRDRRFQNHINAFYDKVIAYVHEADSLLILGPCEAKDGLKKRLEKWKPSGRCLHVETADKMTDPQIAAKARDFFRSERRVTISKGQIGPRALAGEMHT